MPTSQGEIVTNCFKNRYTIQVCMYVCMYVCITKFITSNHKNLLIDRYSLIKQSLMIGDCTIKVLKSIDVQ